MKRLRRLFAPFLPLLLLAALTVGNAQAALLDFGPTTPEVVGSTPPNISAGFPLWFRDTNRVPLQLCLEEVPGCLFAAVDRPNLGQPLAFPNIPDELFYYSATATIGPQLLFAGVEMNFADNGDGTYDQVGFSRVRIRIDSTVAGDYTVTTPWKQYLFTVDQATIDANAGVRVINATEDIGLRPDGDFAGVLEGNVGPYGYSQGAPFVTAAGSFLGDNTPRPLVGTPNNIFRIEGPAGFTAVETNLFAVTGKIYNLAPVPTPLTVDKLTYARDAAGVQVSTFATTQPLSNQTNPAAPFPLNFALTGAESALEVSGTGIPTHGMTTNNPKDGQFFSSSSVFDFQGLPLNATATVTNTADVPLTTKVVPLVDQVDITKAEYNPLTSTLSIAAISYDSVANPALQAFIPGNATPLGTLANGQLSVPFPISVGAGQQAKTYNIPPLNIMVVSAKGGSATAPVTTFVAAQNPPTIAPTLVGPSGEVGTATPTYTWSAVPDATGYTFFTDLNGGITTSYTATAAGCATGTGNCSVTPATPIPAGVSVGWIVNAVNAGGPGPWSAPNFISLASAPAAPTLVSPSGTIATATPIFTWNAVPDATSYTLFTDMNGGITTTYTAAVAGCATGTGTCSAIIPGVSAPAGVSIGWIVNAVNVAGTSAWSAPSFFTVP